jgi:anti-sigma factor RsiW
MPTCEKMVRFCLDYLEGSLPDDERRRFERHLSDCPPCVDFFETYRNTPIVLRKSLCVEMPLRVKDAIREFLRDQCTDRSGSESE